MFVVSLYILIDRSELQPLLGDNSRGLEHPTHETNRKSWGFLNEVFGVGGDGIENFRCSKIRHSNDFFVFLVREDEHLTPILIFRIRLQVTEDFDGIFDSVVDTAPTLSESFRKGIDDVVERKSTLASF